MKKKHDMKVQSVRSGTKDISATRMGLFPVVCMFFALISCDAFGAEEMIPECGPGLTIVLLAAIVLFWFLPYGLICAEMGAVRPVEGGSLEWVREALGEFWFAMMVFMQVVWSLVCNTAYVVLAVNYLGMLIPMSQATAYTLMILIMLICFIINILGISDLGRANMVLSMICICAFAFMTIIGFLHAQYNPFVPFFSGEYDTPFGHIGAGLAVGIWLFAGVDDISVMAGEIKESGKIIPRALLIAVPLIAMVIILPTVSGIVSIGQWSEWTTDMTGIGYSTVLSTFIAPSLGALFLVIAVISQITRYNVCIATASRCVLILSDSHFGPSVFNRLTKKSGVPFVALILVTAFSIILIPFGFTMLVVVDVFFMVLVSFLTVISAMVLKRRIPREEFPFVIPGGKVSHTILSVMVLCISGSVPLVNGVDWFLGGLIWILFIPLFYILGKKKYKGCTLDDPKAYPVNPRTGLGYGDGRRIGLVYVGLGIFASLSRFFLQWYEGSWGPAYYLENYGSGLFSDFRLMLNVISILGLVCILAGLLCWGISKKKSL